MITSQFGPELYTFAENLATIWRQAAHAHKVGRGYYIALKP
jgi:hypothetical protein